MVYLCPILPKKNPMLSASVVPRIKRRMMMLTLNPEAVNAGRKDAGTMGIKTLNQFATEKRNTPMYPPLIIRL